MRPTERDATARPTAWSRARGGHYRSDTRSAGGVHIDAERLGGLDRARQGVAACLIAETVPARPLINPLLDLWAAAHEVHPWIAVPVERLLGDLVGRDLAGLDEISDVLEDVRLLELEVRAWDVGPGLVRA